MKQPERYEPKWFNPDKVINSGQTFHFTGTTIEPCNQKAPKTTVFQKVIEFLCSRPGF